MADESPPAAPVAEETAPAKPRRRRTAPAEPAATAPAPKAETTPAKKAAKDEEEGPTVPRRATLPPRTRVLLGVRRSIDGRRPVFGRQAANRYYRIGRDLSWRRPRGLQSKQRRHYGYRAQIVRIGYRSPAAVRGLVPSGFRPVLVRGAPDLEGIDAKVEAAVIARTVGTRRRLILEEAARKLGIRVLNPIVKGETEA